ncbi:MAG: HEAT repeat domain-containing protein [Planctomycetota bacterium]
MLAQGRASCRSPAPETALPGGQGRGELGVEARGGTRRVRWVRSAAALALWASLPTCVLLGPDQQDELQAVLDLADRRAGGDELQARLRHRSSLVRTWAVRGLGTLGDRVPHRAVAEVLLHDTDAEVRAEAAVALLRLGGDDVAFGAALLEDRDPAVRRQAALGLGATPGPAVAAAGLLRLALDDPDATTRAAAAWGLAHRTEPAARGALASLLAERLDHESEPRARLGLVTALNELGSAATAALSDIVVSDAREVEARQMVERALQGIVPSSWPPANPNLLPSLHRWLRSGDAPLVRAAAAALVRAVDGHADPLPARALLDALARGSPAAPALLDALATLAPQGQLRAAATEVAELATADRSPAIRAAGLAAIARLHPPTALRAVQHGLVDGDVVTRAAAAGAALHLVREHAEAERMARRALADSSSWVTASAMRADAEASRGPLRTLAAVDEELVLALATALRIPRLADSLSAHLAQLTVRAEVEPVTRALAVRATAVLADPEDLAARTLLAAVRHDGDEWSRHALGIERSWSTSLAPRLRASFDWRWLRVPPRLFLHTDAGTVCIELAPTAAPTHVCQLLSRMRDVSARPTVVLERRDGCLRLGRTDLRQPPAEWLLRREPSAHDPFAPGLLGFVPSGLPDLDGLDLFLTLEPHPLWAADRTIVGRVVDGMEAVASLDAGARILDITELHRPN